MIRNSKLVRGVGVNDADYPIHICENIDGKWTKVWQCPVYRTWASMLERCYSSAYKAKRPTYEGCTVTPEWLTFSKFREWMLDKDWECKQLDKDILAQGNKVYSPTTCVFVSRQLNTFMADCGAARGRWPIGVHFDKTGGKFMAQCCNPFTGKSEYLGLFTDPEEAHDAWRSRKHELACIYADQQTDERLSDALRNRYQEEAK